MRTILTRLLPLTGAALLLAAFAAPAAAAGTTYTITVTNLTGGQPLSPPIVVFHTSDAMVWQAGQPASAGVQSIAETGDADPLAAALGGAMGVSAIGRFDAPILPGASASIDVEAPEGSLVSVVSMLVCTNDGFTGVTGGALSMSGSTVFEAMAYDAGTEMNTELTTDIVDPCGAAGPVAHDPDGNDRTGTSDPISAHPGITGSGDLSASEHGWTGTTARIEVSAAMSPTAPSTGTGLAPSTDESTFPATLVITALALMVAGAAGAGTLAARNHRS